MADPSPVIVCLTAAGADLARRLAPEIGAEIHGRAGRADAPVIFQEATAHVRDLFAAGVPVIGVCAAGILIRAVAPLLSGKSEDPPIIALAEDGSAVIPLLGGHRGANRLAAELGRILGIPPSITTAGDLSLGVALDDPTPGWRLADSSPVGQVAADIMVGRKAELSGTAQFLEPLTELPEIDVGAPPSNHAKPQSGVTLSILSDDGQPDAERTLRYEQVHLTLGVGCARDCPTGELADLVHSTMREAGLRPESLAGVFSLDLKADEAAVLDFAAALNLPFRVFSAAELEVETPRLANPSDVVFAEVGCHGVAEAAALAAAGPDAELIVAKRKSANATTAIARAPAPISTLAGRPRGRVSLIGIGPGQAVWRTPEASRLIARADELVGYGLYIDLIGPLARGKPRADFPLGGEEDRCRYALEEAGKGRDVALICSGDAGIYAMGALVYELMARDGAISDAARRVDVVTAPGISALQAAAARAGAPLGHDFCAISLSDLLTPRADIEARVRAAAQGDFVIAFYNPVSKRRRDLFPWAIDVLLAHRPRDTPVVLAASLGRPEEDVALTTLAGVSVETVDMLTTVIIGSSQSRLVRVGGRQRVFTPRGYAAKHAGAAE